MAKASTATKPKAKKKGAKSGKSLVPAGARTDGKKGGKSKSRTAGDALWKLAEHPLIGELLAVGATAAVAAIAEQSLAKKPGGSKANARAVKTAGKAAAAAIGARLISEFTENAGKKPKSAKS